MLQVEKEKIGHICVTKYLWYENKNDVTRVIRDKLKIIFIYDEEINYIPYYIPKLCIGVGGEDIKEIMNGRPIKIAIHKCFNDIMYIR